MAFSNRKEYRYFSNIQGWKITIYYFYSVKILNGYCQNTQFKMVNNNYFLIFIKIIYIISCNVRIVFFLTQIIVNKLSPSNILNIPITNLFIDNIFRQVILLYACHYKITQSLRYPIKKTVDCVLFLYPSLRVSKLKLGNIYIPTFIH